MSQALVATEQQYKIDFTDEQKKVIRNQFFPPAATDSDMIYCMEVARSVGLNPILKEIYFVERKQKVNGNWITRVEPMPGRNAWYKVAHLSGKFGGIESETHIESVPFFENGRWAEKPDLVATATVYRTDTDKPFTVKVAYHEYVQRTSKGEITSFWKNKPETMLKKVAEVQALRKAFSITGLYDEAEVGEEIVVEAASNDDRLKNIDDVISGKAEPSPERPKEPDTFNDNSITFDEEGKPVFERESAPAVNPTPDPNATPDPSHDVEKEEAPKVPKRMPLKISKHYPALLAAGVKQKELKDFVVRVGLLDMDDLKLAGWFETENLIAWVNWFHGVGPHPKEVSEQNYSEAEIEEPMTEAEREAEEVFAPKPQAPTPQQTPEPTMPRQRGAAGIDGISAAVVAHYGTLINAGLAREDCAAFVRWAGLTAENVDEFISDPGGVAGLIEQFKSEVGYAS